MSFRFLFLLMISITVKNPNALSASHTIQAEALGTLSPLPRELIGHIVSLYLCSAKTEKELCAKWKVITHINKALSNIVKEEFEKLPGFSLFSQARKCGYFLFKESITQPVLQNEIYSTTPKGLDLAHSLYNIPWGKMSDALNDAYENYRKILSESASSTGRCVPAIIAHINTLSSMETPWKVIRPFILSVPRESLHTIKSSLLTTALAKEKRDGTSCIFLLNCGETLLSPTYQDQKDINRKAIQKEVHALRRQIENISISTS